VICASNASAPEVSVQGAVAQHVEGGREHGSRDGNDGVLATPLRILAAPRRAFDRSDPRFEVLLRLIVRGAVARGLRG